MGDAAQVSSVLEERGPQVFKEPGHHLPRPRHKPEALHAQRQEKGTLALG